MIEIRDLHIQFDGRTILEGINMSVPAGTNLVLLGKNGSGKSVLLKTIAGLINSYSGSVRVGQIEARDYHGLMKKTTDNTDRPSVAYVFQKGGLFDSMNVYDNVAFGLRRRGVEEDRISGIVESSLARVGLAGSEFKLPSELSGGMQKRVGLARAVCFNPDIILYDDPTAGLDPVLSDSIADLILEIRGSLSSTSIVVTHDLKVVEKIADRVALLYGGRIVFEGLGGDFFRTDDPFAKQFIAGDIEGPIDIY